MTDLQKATILVVDDTPDNLKLISGLLKEMYKVKIATCGESTLEIAQSDSPPDLILLDIMMPEMDGYEVCARLKASSKTAHIPVIFLTAKTEVSDETKGLEMGAVDYISKPINPLILLSRVKIHLTEKKMHDFLNDKNSFLENEVKKRTAEINAIQDVTIHAMASLAETRDSDTGHHIRRTQHYLKLLAEKMRYHPRFSDFLNDDNIIDALFKSAPLHDIGKIGIPDKILLKPGRFEPAEFEIMKRHPELGRNAILHAERELGIEVPFLKYAKEIAYAHQEKWDGSGYPLGISGDEIPISARLMAVADVYDALISRRVYKEGMSHDDAVQIIIEGSGKHFDPDIVDAFLTLQGDFKNIAAKYVDSDEDLAKKYDV